MSREQMQYYFVDLVRKRQISINRIKDILGLFMCDRLSQVPEEWLESLEGYIKRSLQVGECAK